MLSIIVACAENQAIGYQGSMPWHLSGDLKYLRGVTTGHTVIMGRKTYEGIGKPLPNRHNIVVTRHPRRSAVENERRDIGDSVQLTR